MVFGAQEIVGRGVVEILPDMRRWNQQLRSDMRTARRQLDGTAAGLRASARTISDSLAMVGKGAAALGVGVAAVSVKIAGDFQAHTAVLRTAAGETAAGLKTVRKGILDLATGTGTGIQNLTDGMYTIEKAGYRGAEGLKVLKAAAQGAREENASLADVTDAMTSIMASYHLKAVDSVRVMNAMKTAAGEGKITMEEFSGALSTVLPIASANHIAFENIAGSMATLTQHGTSAREATHELAATIRALASPNNVASRMMARMGLDSVDISQNLGKRGLAGTLELLSKTILTKMGPSGKVLLSAFEGSTQAAKDAQVMYQQMPTSIRKLADEYRAGNILQKDWNKDLKEVPVSLRPMLSGYATLVSRSRGFSRELKNGSPSVETYTSILKKMTGGAIGLNTALQLTGESEASNEERVKKVGASFHHTTKDVEGWKVTSALLNVQLDRLKATVQVIGIKIGTVFLPVVSKLAGFLADHLIPVASRVKGAFLDMVPVGRIKQDISDLTRNARDFIGALTGAPQKVPAPKLPKNLPPSVIQYGYALKGSPGEALGTSSQATVMGTRIRQMLNDALSHLDATRIGAVFGTVLGKALQWLTAHVSELTQKLAKTLGSIDWVNVGRLVGGNAVGFAIGFVAALGSDLFSASFWKKHWWDTIVAVVSLAGVGKLAGIFGRVFEHVPVLRLLAPMLSKVDRFTGPIQDFIGKILKFFGKGFAEGFSKVFPEAAAYLEREFPLLTTRLGVWAIRLREAAGKMVTGFAEGFAKFSTTAVSRIGELFFLVLREFGRLSARGAVYLAKKGAELTAGLARGIASRAGTWGTWVLDHVIKPVTAPFSGAGRWLVDKGGSLISGLLNGATSGLSAVGRWAKGVFNAIVGAVKHVFGIRSPSTVMAGLGGHMMAGLFKGLLSGRKALNAAVKGIFHGPLDAARALIKKGVSVTGFLGSGAADLMAKLFGAVKYRGSGATQWSGLVATALSQLGAPPSALGAVLKRIAMESGGNPNAINTWDSNAKAGHPSQGLMQTIPGTFAAYAGPYRSRGILDPMANIYAGINYAMHRYGSHWIQVMTRPGGYAGGTGGAASGWAWVGEEGPELVRFKGGETVLSHPDSVTAAVNGSLRGYASGTHRLTAAQREAAAERRRAEAEARAEARSRARYGQKVLADLGRGFLGQSFIVLLTSTRAKITSTLRGLENDIVKAFKGVRTTLDDKLIALINRGNQRLQSLASQRDAIAAKIVEAKTFARDTASSAASAFGLGNIAETYGATPNGLIGGLRLSEGKIRSFNRLVAKLRDMGLRKDLIAQIVAMGPVDGSRIASLIASQSKGYVRQLNKEQAGIVSASGTLGRTAADALYDSGKQAGRGFLAGLKAQQKSIEHLMLSIAKSMQKAIRRALGIRSPSTVFQTIGDQTGAGLINGLTGRIPHVRGAVRAMAGAMTGAAHTDLPDLPGVGAVAGGTARRSASPEIHVHFTNSGVIGSRAELDAWLVRSWQRLQQQRRIA